MTTLDKSKILMYKFYYDYLKPKYGEKFKLLCTNTDSFILRIETEDFCKDIAHDLNEWFDTSAYDKKDNRPLPIGINEKVLGKFKDELNGKVMTEFCELTAKTLAFSYDYEEIKKAKGTKKCAVAKTLKPDH